MRRLGLEDDRRTSSRRCMVYLLRQIVGANVAAFLTWPGVERVGPIDEWHLDFQELVLRKRDRQAVASWH
jgi:hypothetical protein